MTLDPRHAFRRSIEMLSAAQCPDCHLALEPNLIEKPPCEWCKARVQIVSEYMEWQALRAK